VNIREMHLPYYLNTLGLITLFSSIIFFSFQEYFSVERSKEKIAQGLVNW